MIFGHRGISHHIIHFSFDSSMKMVLARLVPKQDRKAIVHE
jgi:hypothetical protein